MDSVKIQAGNFVRLWVACTVQTCDILQ